jgi:hypothetical protein
MKICYLLKKLILKGDKMEKITKDISKVKEALGALSVDWQVNLDAWVEIDGMKIEVKFNKPIPETK